MRAHLLSFVTISVCLFISLSQAELCNPHDKKVLLQIQESLGNPYVLTSWKKTTDCCTDWYIVKCDPKNHRIISLNLFADDLAGEIPPAIGDLPYLQSLDLHKLPNITGSIPPEITKLKQLTFLRLDWLNLTGPIPSFLAQLKKLTYINLAFNKLSGPIPGQLGSLPNLQALFLSRNSLSGSIPSALCNLKTTSLYIDLSHNKINGSLPPQMTKLDLSYFNVSYNRLCGQIPVGGALQSFHSYEYLHNKCLCGAPLPACK